jgi:hypothetical protein
MAKTIKTQIQPNDGEEGRRVRCQDLRAVAQVAIENIAGVY